MPGPFDGIRILDLTSVISGPLATMILADQGADVIKIEAPEGDYSRHVATRRGGFSASFLNNNRNKRSIVLNMKKPDAIEAFKRLVKGADVVIQNFRPGVANRMGIGEETLRAINPSLVYASICGFGFEGPYAQKPVFDPLIQAVSGLTTVQAGSDDERPRLVRTILPDKLTAIQASQAIAAALFARERTGEGQHISLTMLDTMVSFLWSSDMGGHTFVGDELAVEEAQSFIDLVYKTADGYVTLAIMQDKHWKGFVRAIDRLDLLEMEQFSNAEMRELNKNERINITQEALRAFTSKEIIERLEHEDVPCAHVHTRREMRLHPQVIANGAVIEIDHPLAGRLRQARHPAQFSKTAASIRRGAPALGEHTRDVLAEFDFAPDEISSLEHSGAIRPAVSKATS